MRTIDADALWKDITRNIEYCDDILNIIEKQPTIRLEQKKGHWIQMFDGRFVGGGYWFQCSECKRIVPEVRNGGWDFCPKCGAKNE